MVAKDEPTESFDPFCIMSIGQTDCVVPEPVLDSVIVFSFVPLEKVDGTETDVPFLGWAFAFGLNLPPARAAIAILYQLLD